MLLCVLGELMPYVTSLNFDSVCVIESIAPGIPGVPVVGAGWGLWSVGGRLIESTAHHSDGLASLGPDLHVMPMTEITSRLSTALADRYKIERHLGECLRWLAHSVGQPVARSS